MPRLLLCQVCSCPHVGIYLALALCRNIAYLFIYVFVVIRRSHAAGKHGTLHARHCDACCPARDGSTGSPEEGAESARRASLPVGSPHPGGAVLPTGHLHQLCNLQGQGRCSISGMLSHHHILHWFRCSQHIFKHWPVLQAGSTYPPLRHQSYQACSTSPHPRCASRGGWRRLMAAGSAWSGRAA